MNNMDGILPNGEVVVLTENNTTSKNNFNDLTLCMDYGLGTHICV